MYFSDIEAFGSASGYMWWWIVLQPLVHWIEDMIVVQNNENIVWILNFTSCERPYYAWQQVIEHQLAKCRKFNSYFLVSTFQKTETALHAVSRQLVGAQPRNHGWKVEGDQDLGLNTGALAPRFRPKVGLGVWCGRESPLPGVRVRGITPGNFLKIQMLNPAF